MTSPWVKRAQRSELPAVDRSGAIYRVEEGEARLAAAVSANRCTYQPYTERDGTFTHCTREANHAGGCWWPERKSA